jgi:hypothetical protein
MDGIIKPVDDPFWKKYYPPNGWRCRCGVTQTAETVSKDIPTVVPSIKPEFQSNIGLSNHVFDEGDEKGTKPHPYFALSKNKNSEALEKSFEISKVYAPYSEKYTGKTGGKVIVNPFANDKDFETNLESAKRLVDNLDKEFGVTDVRINPNLNRTIVPGKNHEFTISGLRSDLKAEFKDENYGAIKNAIKSAKKQKIESIVIDFTYSFSNLDTDIVFHKLNGKFSNDGAAYIKELYLIFKNKAIKVTRQDFIDKKAQDLIKRLEA